MSLENRVTIVTGGSSGIGRGIACRLGAEGSAVVIGDLRRAPKQGRHYQTDVTTPTDELLSTEYGSESLYVETDVADQAAVSSLVDRTLEEFGTLDIVVNNAGILIPGDSQELSVADWQRMLAVNLTGTFQLAKEAIPHLKESPNGRIINVSSVNAYFGGGGPGYAATKAAIVNLTRDLAVELAAAGVTVNTVLPGVIKTPMQDLNDEATMERQAANTPLPRLGEPTDVANAVAFLVSEEAEWITGEDLLVDGGYMAGGY